MTTLSPPPQAIERSRGGGYLWAGVAACLLGIALAAVQFSLKQLFTPWYAPALATIGAVLLLVAVARRRTIIRVLALVVILAVAGLQWLVLGSLMKLPAYEGPARAGQPFPAFQTAFADGRTFTDADLRDGSRRCMVFFRGRW
jgi:hypothetical protein